MAISAQDYEQWFKTTWVPVRLVVGQATGTFDWLQVVIGQYDEEAFVAAVGDYGYGLNQINETRRAVVEARVKLEQLHTEEQRKVASPSANKIIDDAIQSGNQFVMDLDRSRMELNDVTSKYYSLLEEVKANGGGESPGKTALMSVEGLGWPKTLGEASNLMKGSFEKADSDAYAISGIPHEDLMVGQPIAVAPVRRAFAVKETGEWVDDPNRYGFKYKQAITAQPDPGSYLSSMTVDRVKRAVVDKWNEVALKALPEKEETSFYEFGDLVIIDAKQAGQPYLEWAVSEQLKMNEMLVGRTKIIMTKKGGVFDVGEIKATGVSNRSSFEEAIKRVSKKKVVY